MAALITFWSSEPVGLKEVPGPTLIIAPEQFVEKKQINKNKGIKIYLAFTLITNLSMALLSNISYVICLVLFSKLKDKF
ncbi:hypothetical protein RG963_04835 [Methanosarcina sp. Z-7115]|uniref:Uncharacterized protein n=1 Tax=Methanosarcina baikalica TaxID=3073890 RepID=A0ABU2CZJ1_9EURY|nr:hypothetical protein [Methanosarcina sp. Z-7115]MDR7665123.1 hypothetical protein [Methanosarcina sp. Z-7115]